MKLTGIITAAIIILSVMLSGCKQEQAADEQNIETTRPVATVPAERPADTAKPANKDGSKPTVKETTKMPNAEMKEVIPGLEITEIKIGTGAEAKAGKTISVHYTGRLTDGTKFDSSLDRNEPFTFTLGAGQVIEGWDKGFAGMKVGGKRKLKIAPALGYGANPTGPIPANSTLIFDVELLEVK